MKKCSFCVFGAVVAVFICTGMLLTANFAVAQDNGIENLRNTGKAFAAVAKMVTPAVVFVQVEKKVAEENARSMPFDDDLFRRFFGNPFPYQRRHPPPPPPPHPKKKGGRGGFFFFL